jgi:hypothetical protein
VHASDAQPAIDNLRHLAHCVGSHLMVVTIALGVQTVRQARSNGEKPKVQQQRLYLRPEEAQRLIEAAGKRLPFPRQGAHASSTATACA